jgi:serine/threonine protein kinase
MTSNINRILKSVDKHTLDLDDFRMTEKVRSLISKTSKLKPLGKGGVGAVYDIGNNKILKISAPCKLSRESTASKSLCKVTKSKDPIFLIPYGSDSVYMLTNILTEGIISGILGSNRELAKYYGKTMGMYYDQDNSVSYIIQEKYESFDVSKIQQTKTTAYLILYQIAYALALAQEHNEFTHYDLHPGNLLFTYDNTELVTTVPISKELAKEYTIQNPNIGVKIIDFGLSRSRTNNGRTLIQPRHEIKPYWATFNRYYDFVSLLGTLLVTLRGEVRKQDDNRSRFTNFMISMLSMEEIVEILRFMFKIPATSNFNYEDLYDFGETGKMQWRAKAFSPLYVKGRDMYETARFLLNKMASLGTISISTREIIKETPSFNKELYPYGLNDYQIQFEQCHCLGPGFKYCVTGMKSTVARWVASRGLNPSYHHTGSYKVPEAQQVRGSLWLPKQVVHVLYINSKIAQERGFHFTTSCCKMDPRHYMQNNTGAAINGSFFKIKNSFEPIGEYKHGRIKFDNAIPALYKDKYGAITIENNNVLIHDTVNVDDDLYSDVVVAGPVLVHEGVQVFDNTTIESRVNATSAQHSKNVRKGNKWIYPFQCKSIDTPEKAKVTKKNKKNNDLKNKNTDLQKDYDDYMTKEKKEELERAVKFYPDGVANCKAINPGELSHASNPNPRSMLIIRDSESVARAHHPMADESYDVAFVVVEGRGNRGDGVDLDLLAMMAVDLGAVNAINLDGGQSSAIVWSFGNHVFTNNGNNVTEYVAGNIISVVQK